MNEYPRAAVNPYLPPANGTMGREIVTAIDQGLKRAARSLGEGLAERPDSIEG